MKGMLSRYRLRNTLIAAGLALVGILLVLLYVTSYRKNVQHGADLVTVFVASRDIPEGTPGTTLAGGGYLRKESVLRRSVVPGAISRTSQIADLASASTIVSGEQVSVRQFHPVIQQGVLASISGNGRAMTVPGDPNQLLSGTVKDGDRVDVLVDMNYTIRPPGAGAGSEVSGLASRIILRNLLVLRAPTSSSGGGLGGTGNGTSITLALTDTQAQKLLLAMKSGSWWLVLRPVARPSDSPESVETIGSLISDGLGPKALEQLASGGGGSGSNGG
jgi:Flp pilus assembly protein CpaB